MELAGALGPEAIARLTALGGTSAPTDHDLCWAERTLTGASSKLRAPYDRLWEREFARARAVARKGDYSFMWSGFEKAGR